MESEQMLEDMLADSQSMPSDDGLKKISRLAEVLVDKEEEIKEAETRLKLLKEQLKEIAERQLPDAMSEVGMAKFALTDGSEVTVKPYYSAKIGEEKREECFTWLQDHGHEALIKDEVSITFNRGEHDKAEEFKSHLDEQGLEYNGKMGVHPQTLTAFVKEQVESGSEFPLELFNVYIGQIAKVKRSKS
jgi:predicted nucleic acid-binding OB-fold protein